jgi:8-oxo-dGTP pyrophosphatase MutT (NUDIX family)
MVAAPGVTGMVVLMVRRPPGGMFGDAWVFPGGVVDPLDGSTSEGDSEPSTAFKRAAVRELTEEVGLVLAAGGLHFVSRWITPALYPRRFDTYFFLAPIPVVVPVTPAAGEIEEAAFVTPAAALAAHQAQQWRLVLPTLAHLRWLARFATPDEAMAAAATARPDPISPMVAADGSLIPVDLPA